jgi:hypothetical protein
MRFNARFDMYHPVPLHLFMDAGVVADSLIGVQNMLKCLFVINRGCIHKWFLVIPTGNKSNGVTLECVDTTQRVLLHVSIGYCRSIIARKKYEARPQSRFPARPTASKPYIARSDCAYVREQ